MAISTSVLIPNCWLDEFAEWGNFDKLTFNTLSWDGCLDCPVHEPECQWWVEFQQHDRLMNRQLLAQRLCGCAEEIKDYLGTFVSPTWTSETHQYPKYWMTDKRKEIYNPSECIEFQTNCWNVTDFGQPMYTFHETVATTPIDEDDDGLNEAYSIEFILPTGVEIEQLQFYFPNRSLKSGLPDQHFQICSIQKMDYDENTNTVCVVFDSWNLVRPELYIIPSWQKLTPLRVCDDIYTPTIEVWSEQIDPCKPQVEVFWNSYGGCDCDSDSCDKCSVTSRFACVNVLDECEGLFNFSLVGTDENGCPDLSTKCIDAPCRVPDYFKVYYRAGLDTKSAKRALFLLTSGKYNEVGKGCECDCVQQVFGVYSQALIIRDNDSGFSFTGIKFDDIAQMPFSPTLGGYEAWRILREIIRNRCC